MLLPTAYGAALLSLPLLTISTVTAAETIGQDPFAAHANRARSAASHSSFRRNILVKKAEDAVIDIGLNASVQIGGNNDNDANKSKWLQRNCVTWGMYPDDGNRLSGSTGQLEFPDEYNRIVGTPTKYFGSYAHVRGDLYNKTDPGTWFNGYEITPYTRFLKDTGATAVLSVMPAYGWGGLTTKDNTQALEIAKVVKKFDDAGIDVLLRFGHEMNWYTTPNSDDTGTQPFYFGGGPEYVEGWKTVTKAVRAAVPGVKMFWSPNVADKASDVEVFWPGAETVDIIGVDYYPKKADDKTAAGFAKHLQSIHDVYAKANNLPFHVGETGLASSDDQDAKIEHVKMVTSKELCELLPNLEAVHWFNFNKKREFRVVNPDPNAEINKAFIEAMNSP